MRIFGLTIIRTSKLEMFQEHRAVVETRFIQLQEDYEDLIKRSARIAEERHEEFRERIAICESAREKLCVEVERLKMERTRFELQATDASARVVRQLREIDHLRSEIRELRRIVASGLVARAEGVQRRATPLATLPCALCGRESVEFWADAQKGTSVSTGGELVRVTSVWTVLACSRCHSALLGLGEAGLLELQDAIAQIPAATQNDVERITRAAIGIEPTGGAS